MSASEAAIQYLRRTIPGATVTEVRDGMTETMQGVGLRVVHGATTMTLVLAEDFLRDIPADAITDELQYREVSSLLLRNPGLVVVLNFTEAYVTRE